MLKTVICGHDMEYWKYLCFYLGDGGPDGFWSDPKLFGACLSAISGNGQPAQTYS